MLQAIMRKVQTPRELQTTSRTINRLGERLNAINVTNDSTRTKRPRQTTHGRDRPSTRPTYASGRDSKVYTSYS